MGRLSNLGYTGISNYFKTLSTFGYKNYSEVDKLLLLLFIEEILEGPIKEYITEDDYKSIVKVLYCLFGSTCLIPYPEGVLNISQVNTF